MFDFEVKMGQNFFNFINFAEKSGKKEEKITGF